MGYSKSRSHAWLWKLCLLESRSCNAGFLSLRTGYLPDILKILYCFLAKFSSHCMNNVSSGSSYAILWANHPVIRVLWQLIVSAVLQNSLIYFFQ